MSRTKNQRAAFANLVRELYAPVACSDWGTMQLDGFSTYESLPAAEFFNSFRVHGKDLIAMREVAKRVSDCRNVELLTTDIGGSHIALIFRPGLPLVDYIDSANTFRAKFIGEWATSNPRETAVKQAHRPALYSVH